MKCRRVFRKVALDSSGMALMMVLAVVTVLALLVTEFTYVSQVNQKMAYDRLDRLQAHYLAKSALKLSLLRLKAFKAVKNLAQKNKAIQLPKKMLDKIWDAPLAYPFPTNIPGMSSSDKDRIAEFQKTSKLKGSFAAIIKSEGSKFNINSFVPDLVAKTKPEEKQKTNSPDKDPDDPNDTEDSLDPNANKNAQNTNDQKKFDVEAARKNFTEFLDNVIRSHMRVDEDFALEYRDLNINDLASQILAWADYKYDYRPGVYENEIRPKRIPFYSLSELHMIPLVDDRLFSVLEPAFTSNITGGINVNKIDADMLRTLVPNITPEESKQFFEFRDSKEADNSFKTPDDFYKFMISHVATLGSAFSSGDNMKKDFEGRGIMIVVDETEFKITIAAEVNRSVRTIEAWVSMVDKPKAPTTPVQPGNSAEKPPTDPNQTDTPLFGAGPVAKDPGLRIVLLKVQ